eukprot:676253-Amphidinium_carterae.1
MATPLLAVVLTALRPGCAGPRIVEGTQVHGKLVVNTHLACRPVVEHAWLCRLCWMPVVRIGEAKNPGPL